jgi:hypothetical protein
MRGPPIGNSAKASLEVSIARSNGVCNEAETGDTIYQRL